MIRTVKVRLESNWVANTTLPVWEDEGSVRHRGRLGLEVNHDRKLVRHAVRIRCYAHNAVRDAVGDDDGDAVAVRNAVRIDVWDAVGDGL